MPAKRGGGGKFVAGGGGSASSGGTPRRVNLRTSFDLIGDWEKALKATKALHLDKAIEKAVRQEAAMAERITKENLTRGGNPAGSPFASLSPWTIAARRLSKPRVKGTKPLMARGDLRASITHVIEGQGRTTNGFVGVLKQTTRAAGGAGGGTRAVGGQKMVNIAAVHEFGKTIVIRITPKMRRFLAVLAKAAKLPPRPKKAKGGGKRFLVIHIKARPFIRPAFAVWSRDAPARFAKRVATFTQGKVPAP